MATNKKTKPTVKLYDAETGEYLGTFPEDKVYESAMLLVDTWFKGQKKIFEVHRPCPCHRWL